MSEPIRKHGGGKKIEDEFSHIKDRRKRFMARRKAHMEAYNHKYQQEHRLDNAINQQRNRARKRIEARRAEEQKSE